MNIQENIPLTPYTTFKIGGPARFFCEAKSEEEILEALKFAQKKTLPVFVLGGGSNILVADKGFDGLVIKVKLSTWRFDLHNGDRISILTCGAGCALSKIVSESVKAGLTGLEWAAGIPGTIGGAARGNAGAYGGTMGEIVESVKVLEITANQGSTFPLSAVASNSSRSNLSGIPQSQAFLNKDCKFDYRDSVFKQNQNLIIASITLKLKKGDKAESEKKIREILAQRKEKQPVGFACPGSFFKNPETDSKDLIRQFETDTGKKVTDHVSGREYAGDKIKIPAPWLIEECGLKGKKIGGAMVSEKHANFIVNTGKATAEDVVMLAAIIKTRVRDKFGIQLKEEVRMVGF